jgi:hypothetical protein
VLLFTPSNDIADANPVTASTHLRPFYVADARDSLVLDTSFSHSIGYRVREILNPLKQRSALVSLIMERYNAWRGGAGPAQTIAVEDAPERALRLSGAYTLLTAHPDSLYLANYTFAKRGVREMARSCAARGVGFVLMSVPLVYEDEAVAELRAVDPTLDPDSYDRDLGVLADTTGFALTPLARTFSGVHRATGARLHWAHWNYAGHRVVGRVLAEALAAPSAPAPAADNR